jgi:hypothetical protein
MSYKHDMPEPDLTLIREFKRRAEEALPGRVVRVMLYGSRARGDARPDQIGTSPCLLPEIRRSKISGRYRISAST